MKGLSEKWGRICKKWGVQTVFNKTRTLRNMLTKIKGTYKNKDKGVVYQIPCGDCNQVYIGESGRPLHVRIKEHQRAVALGDDRNANAVHNMKQGHEMDWGNAKIVEREAGWKKRRIKESIYIKSKGTYNLDSGYPLSPIWDPLIGHLT